MKRVHIQDAERPETQGVFAKPLLEGDQSNVRIIRLAPNQALPPHRHGVSDVMLYAAAGARGSSFWPKVRQLSTQARSRSIVVMRSYVFAIPVSPS
jgi:quercetin dioxygenase-like cupin family protein